MGPVGDNAGQEGQVLRVERETWVNHLPLQTHMLQPVPLSVCGILGNSSRREHTTQSGTFLFDVILALGFSLLGYCFSIKSSITTWAIAPTLPNHCT